MEGGVDRGRRKEAHTSCMALTSSLVTFVTLWS